MCLFVRVSFTVMFHFFRFSFFLLFGIFLAQRASGGDSQNPKGS